MENDRKRKKLISFEEASKIFGYSKDYIMYLAKINEVEIIKENSSCFVDFESLSLYRKNKDERFKKEIMKATNILFAAIGTALFYTKVNGSVSICICGG